MKILETVDGISEVESLPIIKDVANHESCVFNLQLHAPNQEGVYSVSYQLRYKDGNTFGPLLQAILEVSSQPNNPYQQIEEEKKEDHLHEDDHPKNNDCSPNCNPIKIAIIAKITEEVQKEYEKKV